MGKKHIHTNLDEIEFSPEVAEKIKEAMEQWIKDGMPGLDLTEAEKQRPPVDTWMSHSHTVSKAPGESEGS